MTELSKDRTAAGAYDADLVAKAVQGVADAADAGELAHLAATSKVEHCVRDRMAWWLTRALSDDPVFVVREWRRVDLAVVGDGDPVTPRLLIEGKALYHFDIQDDGAERYASLVRRDLTTRRDKWPTAKVVAVVLSTHIGSDIPPRLVHGGIVGYARQANQLLRAFDGDADAAREAMLGRATQTFSTLGRTIGPLTVATGTAWGVDIAVDGWVIEPS